ncbi:hypothetical protein B0O99DRAFT_269560 [Bisporella sp. PMI_857]|nr:hypothetical protein B0O99DRAFT_269560 [Bisporella sp. PMI_857]
MRQSIVFTMALAISAVSAAALPGGSSQSSPSYNSGYQYSSPSNEAYKSEDSGNQYDDGKGSAEVTKTKEEAPKETKAYDNKQNNQYEDDKKKEEEKQKQEDQKKKEEEEKQKEEDQKKKEEEAKKYEDDKKKEEEKQKEEDQKKKEEEAKKYEDDKKKEEEKKKYEDDKKKDDNKYKYEDENKYKPDHEVTKTETVTLTKSWDTTTTACEVTKTYADHTTVFQTIIITSHEVPPYVITEIHGVAPSTTIIETVHVTSTVEQVHVPQKSTITEVHGPSTTVLETAHVTVTKPGTLASPVFSTIVPPPEAVPTTFSLVETSTAEAATSTFVEPPAVFTSVPTFAPSATPVQQINGTSPPITFVGSASHSSLNTLALSIAGAAGFVWFLL